MDEWYDKDGSPIASLMEWAIKVGDDDYKRVAKTELPDGKWVSTVWLGIDHGFGRSSKPLIFETMVFPKHGMRELDMDRYSTLEEALAGHARMVEKHRKAERD